MPENEDRKETTGKVKVEFVIPPDTIRSKVSGGGSINKQMMEKAEAAVQKHAAGYIMRAKTQVDGLVAAIQKARGETGNRAGAFEDIYLQSHDIRGLGAVFGYDLITGIAASLCDFIDTITEYDENAMEVAGAHADALRGLVVNDIKGDGGQIGRKIAKSLSEAVAKYSPKPPEPKQQPN